MSKEIHLKDKEIKELKTIQTYIRYYGIMYKMLSRNYNH
jgi:hypothetical protein